MIADAPPPRDPAPIAALRDVLTATGFTADGIRAALAAEGNLTPRAADLPVHLRRLPAGTPLSTLIKLFVLGVAVDIDEADRALAPIAVTPLVERGLLVQNAAVVEAPVRLIPLGDLVFACDRLEEETGFVAPDHVVGPSPSSVLLANLTVRRPVDRAVDVGTGCGVEALFLAHHARHVVATDVNPRALAFAAFNAGLNGIANVEFRRGSLLDPVATSAFDLVVSNPPFVISPDSAYVFRDGGRSGDALCRELVRALPSCLRERGFGHVLVGWGHRGDEAASAALARWVEGSGCDAWLLRFETKDPLAYAVSWNRPPRAGDGTAYAALLDRWLGYYRELGFEAISSGAIVLRRRQGRNWVRADALPVERIGAAGEHIARLFEMQDFLGGLADERALLDEPLGLVEAHRFEQVLRCRDGSYAIEAASLSLTDGLRFRAEIDAAGTQLLAQLDGVRTLREAIAAMARRLDSAGREARLDELTRAALPVVRRMLESGFLRRGPAAQNA